MQYVVLLLLGGMFCIYLWFIWPKVLLNANISLLILCLDDLSTDEGGLLKPSPILGTILLVA